MKLLLVILTAISLNAFAQEAHPGRRVCAVAYNSLDLHYSSKLVIPEGAAIEDLNRLQVSTGGNWDNRISRVSVASGCTFIGYQHQDFNINYHTGGETHGFALVLSNDGYATYKSSVLGYENEKISSVKCFCARR